jgi:hypothetical protein
LETGSVSVLRWKGERHLLKSVRSIVLISCRVTGMSPI